MADRGGVVDIVAEVRLQALFGGGDGDVVLQGLPAQQHPAAHGGAVGQRDFDGPALPGDGHAGGDDEACLAFPVGGGHFAAIEDRRGAGDRDILAPGDGIDVETHLRLRGGAEDFDVMGMQRGGPRARVHLYLQGGEAKLGQGDPFLPAKYQFFHGESFSAGRGAAIQKQVSYRAGPAARGAAFASRFRVRYAPLRPTGPRARGIRFPSRWRGWTWAVRPGPSRRRRPAR